MEFLKGNEQHRVSMFVIVKSSINHRVGSPCKNLSISQNFSFTSGSNNQLQIYLWILQELPNSYFSNLSLQQGGLHPVNKIMLRSFTNLLKKTKLKKCFTSCIHFVIFKILLIWKVNYKNGIENQKNHSDQMSKIQNLVGLRFSNCN